MEAPTSTGLYFDLGESPIWDARMRLFFWTDIYEDKIYSFEPSSRHVREYSTQSCTSALITRSDRSILLFQDAARVSLLDLSSGVVTPVLEIAGEQDTRFNDVIADRKGRILAGTEPTAKRGGCLYSISLDKDVIKLVAEAGEPNGLGFSVAGDLLYFVDSVEQTVWRYRYNENTGRVSQQHLFASYSGDELPDGLAVDVLDHVWVAVWGGRRIDRYSQDGDCVGQLYLPTPYVTSMCFGGHGHETLLITTAKRHWAEGDKSKPDTMAGAIYTARPGVKGTPSNRSSLA